jgi:hypothetical protein
MLRQVCRTAARAGRVVTSHAQSAQSSSAPLTASCLAAASTVTLLPTSIVAARGFAKKAAAASEASSSSPAGGASKKATRAEVSDDQLTSEVVNAASRGWVDELMRLKKDFGADLNRGDYDLRTPLHLACAEGHVPAVLYLLEQKVNPNPVDRFGRSPVDDAVLHKHEEVITLMAQHEGHMALVSPSELVNKMCESAAAGDCSQLKNLIAAGGDVRKGDYDGRTPLHLAAREGKVEAIELLIAAGADVSIADRFGHTALHDANRGVGRDFVAAQKVLKEAGAMKINSQFEGPTLLLSSVASLPLLLERGNFAFVEMWVPTASGEEFIKSHWCAQTDLTEQLTPLMVESEGTFK